MFCTKCGTNNEDNNTFCKNCGAKLVKPADNSPVSSASSSSGVAQAAKAVNVKLIAGIVAALVLVVVVVRVLMNVGNNNIEKADNSVNETIVADTFDNKMESEYNSITETVSAVETVAENSEQMYTIHDVKLCSDIESFANFIVDSLYEFDKGKVYSKRGVDLEDILEITSIKKINAGLFSVYESNPKIIVSDEANMEHIDDFVALCGEFYSRNSNYKDWGYVSVTVIDSNIEGGYQYYADEADKIYICLQLSNKRFGPECRYCMLEMIQKRGDPDVWLINDYWSTSISNIESEDSHDYQLLTSEIGEFKNIELEPAWLKAYKEFMKDDWAQMYFIGADRNGVPYLVTYGGSLCHYNGTEVERLLSVNDLKYNPDTNKALIYSYSSGMGFYEVSVLEDLYTATEEMSCNSYEDSESGIVTYSANGNEVSKDEYERVLSEMDNRFGTGGYLIEQDYPSVDEAYEAYMSNRGSIPASNSAPATNASESAGTAISNNASASEYILKDSSSRYLTKDDLQGFSADDCRIARNEIYARHGRKFDDEGLQSHFNSCSWYQGTIAPSDFDETMLSDIEIANKNLIVEYEKEKGYRQ